MFFQLFWVQRSRQGQIFSGFSARGHKSIYFKQPTIRMGRDYFRSKTPNAKNCVFPDLWGLVADRSHNTFFVNEVFFRHDWRKNVIFDNVQILVSTRHIRGKVVNLRLSQGLASKSDFLAICGPQMTVYPQASPRKLLQIMHQL